MYDSVVECSIVQCMGVKLSQCSAMFGSLVGHLAVFKLLISTASTSVTIQP